MDKVKSFFSKVTSKLPGKKSEIKISDPAPATVEALTNLIPTTGTISEQNFNALVDLMYTTAYQPQGVARDDVVPAVRASLEASR